MLVPLPVSLLYFPLSLWRYAQAPAQIKEFYFQSSMITDVSQTPGGGRRVSILPLCLLLGGPGVCSDPEPTLQLRKGYKGAVVLTHCASYVLIHTRTNEISSRDRNC